MSESSHATSGLTAELVLGERDFASLAEHWAQLSPVKSSPLAEHGFLQAAFGYLHAGDTLRVWLQWSAGRLVGAAPLAAVRRFGVRRLELLGAAVLGEPAALLFEDERTAEALAEVLAARRESVVLQRVSVEDSAVAEFVKRASNRGRVFIRPSSSAPYVEITDSWEGYLATLSSRRRYDYRRNRKRLQVYGNVSTVHHRAIASTVANLYARFVAVEGAGWKSINGSSLRAKPRLQEFFGAASADWAAKGTLRVSFLQVGDEDVAAVLWLVHGQRAWVLKIGYDERWADASPGIQLLWDVLQTAFEERLSGFEFLGGDEAWLSIWAPARHRYRTIVFYPYTALGFWALLTDGIAAVMRKLARVVQAR